MRNRIAHYIDRLAHELHYRGIMDRYGRFRLSTERNWWQNAFVETAWILERVAYAIKKQ